MQRLRTVTSLDVSAGAGHHAMPAALLLDLHLSILDGFVKTKIHDKQDDFDF